MRSSLPSSLIATQPVLNENRFPLVDPRREVHFARLGGKKGIPLARNAHDRKQLWRLV